MRWMLMAVILAAALPARAAERRPVVAELFTSEGCSSCPPADALLGELARSRPDVLALAFHVTYWDRLGWADPYGLSAATARQHDYAARLGLDGVYTPQLVIDGRREMVGSDRGAVLAALDAAAAGQRAVPLAISRRGDAVRVSAGAGAGRGTLLLLGYDAQHRTQVGRGENAGRMLTEANIVRDLRPLGDWSGVALVRESAAPRGEHLAALLQAPDGSILGSAVLQ